MKHIKLYKEHITIDEKYSGGFCEVFALALHKRFNYDMYFLMDEEAFFEYDDYFDTGEALVHAYCKKSDGTMIDINGIIDNEYLKNEYECNVPKTIKVDVILFENMIAKKFIAKPKKKDITECLNHIELNISKYI